MTWPGIELTIYGTCGEHASHYIPIRQFTHGVNNQFRASCMYIDGTVTKREYSSNADHIDPYNFVHSNAIGKCIKCYLPNNSIQYSATRYCLLSRDEIMIKYGIAEYNRLFKEKQL